MAAFNLSLVKIETPPKSTPDESETCPFTNDCPKELSPMKINTKDILYLRELIGYIGYWLKLCLVKIVFGYIKNNYNLRFTILTFSTLILKID